MKSVSSSLDFGNILHASFQVSDGGLNFEPVCSRLDPFLGCKCVFKCVKNSFYCVILFKTNENC